MAAVVVSAIAPFFGVEEPLKVTHLLFVNLVMDGLGAIMLGNEPAQERYMSEPPRRRDESIVSKSMMAQIDPAILQMMADSGARLYFSDCPPGPDGAVPPPHQALTFTVGAGGAMEGTYLSIPD